MHATAGDRITIESHHPGEPKRDGQILEVLGDEGGPPYRVRWEDTGHTTRFSPGSDATVHHYPH